MGALWAANTARQAGGTRSSPSMRPRVAGEALTGPATPRRPACAPRALPFLLRAQADRPPEVLPMLFRSLFPHLKLGRGRGRARGRHVPPRRAPRLEVLEGRTVPSTLT